jgi:organic hydroperoxide reductase OsmC/OhrA
MKVRGMTHEYRATVSWTRGDAVFTDQRYSRGHSWSFDGGITVPASSSPLSVRLPYSVAEAVDPEEAFVAAVSSCHMLTFLYVAAKQGFVVDAYADEALGEMTKNERGKLWVSKVTLAPAITFSGAKRPTPEQLDALHHDAHEECFIANSVKSDVVVNGTMSFA